MAYTAPPTFVSGDPLTAAEMNVLGDDIAYLYGVNQGLTFSGTMVSRAAATSIPNGSWTAITFSAETFDYGAWWGSGATVIVPAGAIPSGFTTIALLIIARTKFAGDNAGFRGIAVQQNGSDLIGSTVGAVDGGDTEIVVTGFTVAEAADTIGLNLYQTSGAALNAAGTTLTVVRYAPAG
jgi:hypothetical protein